MQFIWINFLFIIIRSKACTYIRKACNIQNCLFVVASTLPVLSLFRKVILIYCTVTNNKFGIYACDKCVHTIFINIKVPCGGCCGSVRECSLCMHAYNQYMTNILVVHVIVCFALARLLSRSTQERY